MHGEKKEEICVKIRWWKAFLNVVCLRVCRTSCRYHIRRNKRACDNLTASKHWQKQDEREGMRRTCLSALHIVKSALAAHTHMHTCALACILLLQSGALQLSQSKWLRTNCYSRAQPIPDLLPNPKHTAVFIYDRATGVVLAQVIAQSTFCIS